MGLMANSWIRALAVAAVVGLAACGDRLVEPAAPPAARLSTVGTKAFAAVPAPKHQDVTVSAVLDRRGGYLEAPTAGKRRWGYVLVVPAGAVNKPTTFTLHVLAGERYEVELTAVQGSKDVGGRLRVPVTLSISMADSPAGRLPRSAKLYYLPPDGGTPQPMPSLALPALGSVTAVLPHFSRYCPGLN